jgi:hypothetical protein
VQGQCYIGENDEKFHNTHNIPRALTCVLVLKWKNYSYEFVCLINYLSGNYILTFAGWPNCYIIEAVLLSSMFLSSLLIYVQVYEFHKLFG